MLLPAVFAFNGLHTGLEIDPDRPPTRTQLEYRNAKSGIASYRSERLQVTVKDSIIVGVSSHFFEIGNAIVTQYSSAQRVRQVLGEPTETRTGVATQFSRAFRPYGSLPQMLCGQLDCWDYGNEVSLFFTALDPFEGFAFREPKFWSIAVGELWTPPSLP